MNEQRISLTRILAVQWYGFRQIIDVSNNTLIAGAFGTGKSALLDLMQHVMLGEHWRPNRAAAGNARGRSLISYCLCDTNTTRDGEPHYTRRSGVTIIGLEFTWPKDKAKAEPRRETWGIRIEFASPTSEPKRTYFLIPDRVEWSALAPNGKFREEEEFRTFIRREYGHEFLFARQQDYLAEMATPRHLYFDTEQFWKTFGKAIAFEPEENVEKFIRDFILEESPVNVRDVQIAVKAYKDTQARLEKQEDEAGYLRRICEHHAVCEKARRDQSIWEHTRNALEQTRLTELVDRHRQSLLDLTAKHSQENTLFEATLKEKEQLERHLKEFHLDAGMAELEQVQNAKRETLVELTTLRDARKAVRERLRDRAFAWTNWLKRGAGLKLDQLSGALAVDELLFAALRGDHEPAALEALPALAELFNDLFGKVQELLSPVNREVESTLGRLRQIAEDLERLERDETPGAFPLFHTIKQRLAQSTNPPEQLCRLVEVKPEAEDWRNALELFLGRHRFDIVVAPADYAAALQALKTTPPGREPESLVHPREALELPADQRPGSLAEKIDVQHKVAAQFVRHLLGRLIGVDRVEDLDNHERAITREGVFKQVPLRRRLRQTAGFEFTLGREGLKRLRAAALREQKELMAVRDARRALIEEVHRWVDDGKKAGLGDPRLPDRSAELPRIPLLEKQLKDLSRRAEFLATPERAARLQQWDEMQKQLGLANIKIGELRHSREQYEQSRRELQDAFEDASEDLREADIALTESRVHLFPGILDGELTVALREAMGASSKWQDRQNYAQSRAASAAVTAVNARNARNHERQALAASERHPEYRHDFVVEEDGNEAWAARLELLDRTELPKFRALASERRKDWEQRLQESVLDRLNERLREAERTVRQLRDYLDRNIGRHRYRIILRRDPAYTALWTLLDSGFEPTDELLQVNRSEEVQRALAELMAAVESADQADERARRLLDYRYYHRYDLEMVLASQPDAPPISLGRSGRSLSGGESQAPFFISMLAAFHRVYDLGSSRSQHLGLVVMDEAFSKLSGDGVEDCLDLARNFQLQLIMAFPIDRLGVMAPYADTIVICRKEEQRDTEGYVSKLDNIPIVLTPDEVRESLEP